MLFTNICIKCNLILMDNRIFHELSDALKLFITSLEYERNSLRFIISLIKSASFLIVSLCNLLSSSVSCSIFLVKNFCGVKFVHRC